MHIWQDCDPFSIMMKPEILQSIARKTVEKYLKPYRNCWITVANYHI